MKKAQVSAELLIIVGFIALVMVPVLFSIYVRGGEYKDRIGVSQVNIAAGRIAQAVDSVGFLGGRAKIVLEVQMPKGVSARAQGKEILFSFENSGQRNDIVKTTRFAMSAPDLDRLNATGTYFVEVMNEDGIVSLDVRE
jgi:hypothetical protein